MGIFALVWAMAGSGGFMTGAARLAVILVALIVTGSVVLLGLRVDRQPARDRPRRLPSTWNERYFLVGIAQGVAIGLAVLVLNLVDWSAAIPAVVCLIVGAHFFPLAGTFDQRQYWWTGLALCVVGTLGFGILGLVDRDASLAFVGLGAAVTLWATSGHVARFG